MKLLGTHHVAIQTRDLERLEKFYTETLGLSAPLRWDDKGIVFVDIGSTRIEIIQKDALTPDDHPPAMGQGAGLNHLALHVESTDDAYAELTGKGVKSLSGPADFKSVRIAFLSDPEGNVIELVQEIG